MRQPVKGKPHIEPSLLWVRIGKRDWPLSDFLWPTASSCERAVLDGWAREVDDAWTRWWRQHQEAA